MEGTTIEFYCFYVEYGKGNHRVPAVVAMEKPEDATPSVETKARCGHADTHIPALLRHRIKNTNFIDDASSSAVAMYVCVREKYGSIVSTMCFWKNVTAKNVS